jgi:SagB-type dehydrogenase family enzyme
MSMLAANCLRVAAVCAGMLLSAAEGPGETRPATGGLVTLPAPETAGGMSLTEALARRQSVRRFIAKALDDRQIGQLCWAAQGLTDPARGRRTAPSAGAFYPLELYLVSARGVEQYLPAQHALRQHLQADLRRALSQAALGQEAIAEAPMCFVIAAVVSRSAGKYGERAERYCFLEAGHVAQNILLQATALGLGGVPVGAFEDERVAAVLKLPAGQRVLYLVPVGWPEP